MFSTVLQVSLQSNSLHAIQWTEKGHQIALSLVNKEQVVFIGSVDSVTRLFSQWCTFALIFPLHEMKTILLYRSMEKWMIHRFIKKRIIEKQICICYPKPANVYVIVVVTIYTMLSMIFHHATNWFIFRISIFKTSFQPFHEAIKLPMEKYHGTQE